MISFQQEACVAPHVFVEWEKWACLPVDIVREKDTLEKILP
jgi:hypothetical protein